VAAVPSSFGRATAAGPLLVYGPWSDRYDFGPGHPLTPLRFGPGIDLLRAIGAEPGLAPEPAPDDDLRLCHTDRYIEVVRRFASDPDGPSEAGIGYAGDCPPFADMHEISAAVAGGSLRAVEAILVGDVEHAFHPGGGLHHAMAGRASGFCIYDDPALAIARARREGLRVLYLDFDTHHGDGVAALHADDPGVLTFSIHESGRYLFPGTGFADDLGLGAAAGSIVNVPLEPWTGEGPWLDAVSTLVPELAACFGADLVVSQHGNDAHAWDPLAHLRVTTTAMGAAARLVDRVAHRWSGGRWLATGGGGYDVYRVVPRVWALVWLAGAHREAPDGIPADWLKSWEGPAMRRGTAPLPTRFDDAPNAGLPLEDGQLQSGLRSTEIARQVRAAVIPRLVREAVDRGWLDPLESVVGTDSAAVDQAPPAASIVDLDAAADLGRLRLASRVIAPSDPVHALAMVRAALADGATATAAVDGERIVGLVVSLAATDGRRVVVAVGVAPGVRRRGIGRALLDRHVAAAPAARWQAEVTVAERDWSMPDPLVDRRAAATALLQGAGFKPMGVSESAGRVDREATVFVRT
jgi:acetoin utilization protein AcuC